MRKKIAIILVVIIMFNITGIAIAGNYYDITINNQKQISDEILNDVLKDLEKKGNQRVLYNIGGAILAFGLTFNGFYSSNKWVVWTVPIIIITISTIGGVVFRR